MVNDIKGFKKSENIHIHEAGTWEFLHFFFKIYWLSTKPCVAAALRNFCALKAAPTTQDEESSATAAALS